MVKHHHSPFTEEKSSCRPKECFKAQWSSWKGSMELWQALKSCFGIFCLCKGLISVLPERDSEPCLQYEAEFINNFKGLKSYRSSSSLFVIFLGRIYLDIFFPRKKWDVLILHLFMETSRVFWHFCRAVACSTACTRDLTLAQGL